VTLYKKSGGIAQSVEQGTENPCVASSILAPATIFLHIQPQNFGFEAFCFGGESANRHISLVFENFSDFTSSRKSCDEQY
jgi:hypothetical protein